MSRSALASNSPPLVANLIVPRIGRRPCRPVSTASHAAATPLATGVNEIISGTTNHVMGGFTSVVNEAVRPGGDIQGNFATTAVNGIISGAEGPSPARVSQHAAG